MDSIFQNGQGGRMTAAASRHTTSGSDEYEKTRPMASALFQRIVLINGLVFATGLTMLAVQRCG
ncbi:hypothetical protein [Nonomuraea sp. NPDC005650]|uniref:hypothetical protein n=1 Tax=Nonomuraea sp. NPDC005650 TaxID=3157045 RepID=UPI0033BAD639